MLTNRSVSTLLAVSLIAGALAVWPATAAPEGVPDRLPVASEPLQRARLVRQRARDQQPSVKTVDGQIGDWIGEPSLIGGTARLSAGEHIYSDYLFDDFGADDGDDAQRLAILGPLAEAESRTARADQLFQAAGDQFDAPRPVGAPDRYGDGERTEAADIREVRWAADGDSVDLLVRTTTMTDDRLAVLVLTGTNPPAGDSRDVGFGSGLSTNRFDTAFLLSSTGATMQDIGGGTRANAVSVRVNPDGWTNALEASFPASTQPRTFDVAVVTGTLKDGSFVPANVAYRDAEPVAGTYNDQRQALALLRGNIDEFTARIRTAELRRGASQQVRPGPGYSERSFRSGENISNETGENGIWQPYGLYVPMAYKPSQASPLTFWLHYRGGKAHSGGAWTPRLITQLGEETGNIVVTPRGRGTSTWYVSEAHQDFFEVFDDVHSLLNVDPDRRYLSGYSMGGYGTYLFGLLYPDLFAAGYATSGAMTQGAWTGEGPDDCQSGFCYVEANEGDADAQNTFRVLENARHLPLTIHHGTNDELVPITGIQRVGLRLAELGYRYDLTMFTGYEHYTQAIIDEWADGAAYLNRFTRDRNPRTVTYKVVPALVQAVNTVTADGVEFRFNPDGAYWTDGLVVRDGDPSDPAVSGQLDATSAAIPAKTYLTLPRTGAFSPAAHSTPYARQGLDWFETGDEAVANEFTATARNLSAAALNIRRMALDTDALVTGTVTTDGPTDLTLTDLGRVVTVTLDGQPISTGDRPVTLRLSAGEHTIELRPAG